MDKKEYKVIEDYVLSEMNSSSHDIEHVYRVLYMALEIAKREKMLTMMF